LKEEIYTSILHNEFFAVIKA